MFRLPTSGIIVETVGKLLTDDGIKDDWLGDLISVFTG